MDQKKNQGQQGHKHNQQQTPGRNQGDHGQSSQQSGQQHWNQNPNRDEAEGSRQQMPGRDQSGQRYPQDESGDRKDQNTQNPHSTPERGRGNQGERNLSSGGGISNRGMNRDEEQEDLPPRGSTQSER